MQKFQSGFFLSIIALASFCQAVEVVRVEEEWQLEVGEPSLQANAPQVSMVMSPFSDLEDDFFMFLINHQIEPNYVPGGSQVQSWVGEEISDYNNSPHTDPLDQDADIVRWTQAMSINNGTVTFEVQDGTSASWGGFGGQGYLRQSTYTGQANLNAYHPGISIQGSGIGYAGNRVVSLTLLKITWLLSDGTTHTLSAPIDIDSDLDPWD